MAQILSAFTTLGLVAATPAAGVALVNGTPTFLSWTAPNDGKLHRAHAYTLVIVTTTETGGQISFITTTASGNPFQFVNGGGNGPGAYLPSGGQCLTTVLPGQTVSIQQTTALTVGAATFYGEIWGA